MTDLRVVLWNGDVLTLMPTTVGPGLTNRVYPLACGHRHRRGDTIWIRADQDWSKRVILCEPCTTKYAH